MRKDGEQKINKELRLLEIELFNYCNRTCKWCPNSIIDRKNNGFIYLPTNILHNIGEYLQSINYNNYISFSRYNEPLANIPYLLKSISILKKYAPNAKYVTNTNGDFLTKDNIRQLIGRIDELTIMDYDCNGREDLKKILNNATTINNIDYGEIDDMKVCINHNTFDKNSRGGILDKYSCHRNIDKCFEPLYFIAIDYNGNVIPCCNFRSDFYKHSIVVCGNLFNDKLKHIVYSKKYNKITTDLYDCCKYCNKISGRYTSSSGGIYY